MVLHTDGVDVDEEIAKCHEQIEYWSSQLEKFQKRKKEEKRLDNLCVKTDAKAISGARKRTFFPCSKTFLIAEK